MIQRSEGVSFRRCAVFWRSWVVCFKDLRRGHGEAGCILVILGMMTRGTRGVCGSRSALSSTWLTEIEHALTEITITRFWLADPPELGGERRSLVLADCWATYDLYPG